MERTEPLVAIHFSFGSHFPEDIDRLPQIKKQAGEFFQPDTRNIYMLEQVGVAKSTISTMQDEYKRTGSYFDAFLQTAALSPQGIRRRLNSVELVNTRSKALQRSGFDTGSTAVQSNYLVSMFGYNEQVMLDELAEVVSFELDVECYPDPEARRMGKQHMEYLRLSGQSLDASQKGDAQKAIVLYKESIFLQAQNTRNRNVTYRDRLATSVLDSVRDQRPTRIFIRIGEDHDKLTETFSQDDRMTAPDIRGCFTAIPVYDYGRVLRQPHGSLLLALENDPQLVPTDEQILKAMIGIYVDGYLSQMKKPRPERAEKANKVAAAASADDIANFIRSLPSSNFQKSIGPFIYSKLF